MRTLDSTTTSLDESTNMLSLINRHGGAKAREDYWRPEDDRGKQNYNIVQSRYEKNRQLHKNHIISNRI